VHLVLQLGMGVKVATPRRDIGMEVRDAVDDGHGES
jgi:hypothetical protein